MSICFDVINTPSYRDVWIRTPSGVLTADEVCDVRSCPLILTGMVPLYLGGIFSVDLMTVML